MPDGRRLETGDGRLEEKATPLASTQREFAFAREAQERLIDEAFMGANKKWATPAMRRHVHRLCRTLLACPKPATAELLAARLDVSTGTARGALAVALALGVVTREWVLGPSDRAVQHHAVSMEAIVNFQAKLASPQNSDDYQTLNLSSKFGNQAQPTAMEAVKKTAGEQVPTATRDRTYRVEASAQTVTAMEPLARNVPPKVLNRSSTSVLVLSPRPSPTTPAPGAPRARSTPPAADPLAVTGDVCAAAIAAAVARMPSEAQQEEKLLAALEEACGPEAWPDFAPDVAMHIVRLALEGLHSKGDTGLPPRFFRTALATARRGTTAFGEPIRCRRSYLIGRIGKRCRELNLPWPFGRKGAK